MKITTSIALILAVIMTVLAKAESYSQLHLSYNEPLLYGFLFFIILAFVSRSYIAINKEYTIWKSLKVKHLDFITALLFGGVLIFGVNSEVLFVEQSHLIFTGLAIAVAYLNLVLQQTDDMMKLSAHVAFGLVLISFPIGLLTDLYDTGTAELIASIPLSIHLFTTKTIEL